MKNPKRTFYVVLAAVYPLFFLLHWNGMFSQTYYWALKATGTVGSGLAQGGFALLSSAMMFGAIALVFALGSAVLKRGAPNEQQRPIA